MTEEDIESREPERLAEIWLMVALASVLFGGDSSAIALYRFVMMPMKGARNWGRVLDFDYSLLQNSTKTVSRF